MVLSQLQLGHKGRFEGLDGSERMLSRLASMGLFRNSTISVVRRGGSTPMIVECDGRRIAVDTEIADKIQVVVEVR